MRTQIFVSHKHADKAIAKVVSSFIKKATSNQVGIHNSSDPDFEGPRIGKSLNDQLKQALAQSDVVLLVYTSEDQDWQYCMWECGIATDPWDSHPTDIVVLQCGNTAPKPFADTLRVDARSLDSLVSFTKALLTSKDFFPSLGEKISGYSPEDPVLKEFAQDLYDALKEEIEASLGGEASDLASSTFLRIELPPDGIATIRQAQPGEERDAAAMEALRTHGYIVEHERAASLFGFNISTTTTIGTVLSEWESSSVDGEPLWFDSLAQQVALAVFDRYPEGVPWAPYRSDPQRSTIPYVSRSRKNRDGAMQFDTYFIPVAAAPVKVTARMITTSEAFHKRLDNTPPEQISLGSLIDQMEQEDRTRVPVLGQGGTPKYIIHLSMVEKFLARRARRGGSVDNLTLADLLAVDTMEEVFATSFAVVGPDTSMAEAKAAMNAIPGCQDVFVTEGGTNDDPVLGWLTNSTFVEFGAG